MPQPSDGTAGLMRLASDGKQSEHRQLHQGSCRQPRKSANCASIFASSAAVRVACPLPRPPPSSVSRWRWSKSTRWAATASTTAACPSKALIAAGRRAQLMRSSAPFGIAPVRPSIDHGAVHNHVHGVIAAIAPNDSVERFVGLGVDRHPGHGPFCEPRHRTCRGPPHQSAAVRHRHRDHRPPSRPYRASTGYLTSPTKRSSTIAKSSNT